MKAMSHPRFLTSGPPCSLTTLRHTRIGGRRPDSSSQIRGTHREPGRQGFLGGGGSRRSRADPIQRHLAGTTCAVPCSGRKATFTPAGLHASQVIRMASRSVSAIAAKRAILGPRRKVTSQSSIAYGRRGGPGGMSRRFGPGPGGTGRGRRGAGGRGSGRARVGRGEARRNVVVMRNHS